MSTAGRLMSAPSTPAPGAAAHPDRQVDAEARRGSAGSSRSSRPRPSSIRRRTRGSGPSRSSTRRSRRAWRTRRCRRCRRSESSPRTRRSRAPRSRRRARPGRRRARCAGPAWLAAAVPVSTKMPVPMIAPIPSSVRSIAVSVRLQRLRRRAPTSPTSCSIDFVFRRFESIHPPVTRRSGAGSKSRHYTCHETARIVGMAKALRYVRDSRARNSRVLAASGSPPSADRR